MYEKINIILAGLAALIASTNMNEIIGNVTLPVAMATLAVALVVGVLINTPTFGAEIELIRKTRFLPNHQSLAAWLRQKLGVDVVYEGYTHDYIHHLKVVSDGSLSGGGSEIVLPVTKYGDYGLLQRAMRAIRGLGSADVSCGIHVHFGLLPEAGMSWHSCNADDKVLLLDWFHRMLVAYDHFWPAICKAVAPSRSRSEWAQPPSRQLDNLAMRLERSYDVALDAHKSLSHAIHYIVANTQYATLSDVCNTLYESIAYDRYMAVNLASFSKYGTVEFRQHGGTTNANHIVKWIELMHRFTQVCRESFDTPIRNPLNFKGSDMGSMCDWLAYHPNDTTRNHWMRRTRRFAGQLRKGEECTTCKQNDCDGDDYCPNVSYPVPEDYNRRSLGLSMFDDEDEWGSVSLMGIMGIIFFPLAALFAIINCGIGAYHNAGEPRKVKGRLKALWVGLTSRGKDSAGFAFRSPNRDPNTKKPTDYNGMWISKAPSSAVSMTGQMNKMLKRDTPVVLMHTRLATHGKINKLNAHPHRDPQGLGVTLVHNGMIHYHEYVFKAIGVEPKTKCDSEAAAACLAKGGIEEVVKHCEGSMSLIWTDDRDGENILHFWSNGGNPLAFGRVDDARSGAVVVASTVKHLEDAFGKRLKSSFNVTDGKHYRVLPDGQIESEFIEGSLETTGWQRFTTTTTIHNNTINKFGGKKATKVKRKPRNVRFHSDQWHIWDTETGEGIRPDNTRYDLPQYLDPTNHFDVAEVEAGEHDPLKRKGVSWSTDFDWYYHR